MYVSVLNATSTGISETLTPVLWHCMILISKYLHHSLQTIIPVFLLPTVLIFSFHHFNHRPPTVTIETPATVNCGPNRPLAVPPRMHVSKEKVSPKQGRRGAGSGETLYSVERSEIILRKSAFLASRMKIFHRLQNSFTSNRPTNFISMIRSLISKTVFSLDLTLPPLRFHSFHSLRHSEPMKKHRRM